MSITFIQNLLALLSAGLGAGLAIGIGVSHKQLCALISLAAGTLFGTTIFHVLPESSASMSWLAVGIALGSGYFLFHLVSKYIFHVCPACSASHFEEQTGNQFRSMAILLAIGLCIHSTMDGAAIAMGSELGGHKDHSVFLTILIHKFPEGLALCALFLRAGYSRRKSMVLTLALEASTVFGWFAGAFILTHSSAHRYVDLAMLHISGGFVYLALHAISNEIKKHSPQVVIGFFLAGNLLMFLTRWVHV